MVPEINTHAFVIRLWFEERGKKGRAKWRGHITHVLTGRRRYLQNMGDISAFIESYLQTMTAGDD